MTRRSGIVVTGTINAGKSTLAKKLAASLDAEWISSDAIREELREGRTPRGTRVFDEMRVRLERALGEGRLVVLDSTAMSHRFQTLLRRYRDVFLHVHLILSDEAQFDARERGRSDRSDGPLSVRAFRHSQRVVFHEKPDFTLATDKSDPEYVYALVSSHTCITVIRSMEASRPNR